MNHPVFPQTTSLFSIRNTDAFASMIFEKRIAPRLWDGMPVCLPCYGFRRQEDWEAIKTKLDELLPDGWSSQWGAKAGVLVLTQTPAQHSIPA